MNGNKMKIKIEVNIFDDQKYCEDHADKKDYNKCDHFSLHTDEDKCLLFGKQLDFDYHAVRLKKCRQCKVVY
jgi:hypothetical protein